MTSIRCGNPDTTYTHSHASVLEVKVCCAQSAAEKAGDRAEFRRFLGEEDYARFLDATFEAPLS